MDCKWNGSDRPRIVPNRHDYGCNDEACRGCQPCLEDHCRVCGRAHGLTCPECLASVRADLHEIGRLCDALPEEVEHKGIDSEAAMLLGPTADPEMRQHVEGSYLAGRLPEGWIDASHGKDCPLRTNEPCVGCAGGELHPLTVTGTWVMVWQDALEHEDDKRLTVENAIGYLDRQLTYMAAYEHVPFEDFAKDLRRCVAHLERVLHDGEQVEHGAPCPWCKRNLTLRYGDQAKHDAWVCENRACDVTQYTTAQYKGWVEDDARNNAKRLTAADLERRFADEGLKASAVRVWGSRDLVRKVGKDQHGLTLYAVGDVIARLAQRESA